MEQMISYVIQSKIPLEVHVRVGEVGGIRNKQREHSLIKKEYEYFKPIKPEHLLTCKNKLADVYENAAAYPVQE